MTKAVTLLTGIVGYMQLHMHTDHETDALQPEVIARHTK